MASDLIGQNFAVSVLVSLIVSPTIISAHKAAL
jgi:hypothetical protein